MSVLASTLLALGTGGTFWLPERAAGGAAPSIDSTFYFIYYISLFFFILVVTLMVVFAVKYRRSKMGEPQASPSHNTKLELTWTIIPAIPLVFMFYFGFVGYMDARIPPDDSYEIAVTAQMWSWTFQYPTGHEDSELHVPANRNVRVVLSSKDVLHAFFIPEFRVKMDVVPGRFTKAWFRATTPGTYELKCAEYCGRQHSLMRAKVIVHSPAEFEAWLEGQSAAQSPVALGAALYKTKACVGCHSIDGSRLVGPSWKGLYGAPVPLSTGETVMMDENYIRESILEPNAKFRAGFENMRMNSFQGIVTDDEIYQLTEYIKSLADGQSQ